MPMPPAHFVLAFETAADCARTVPEATRIFKAEVVPTPAGIAAGSPKAILFHNGSLSDLLDFMLTFFVPAWLYRPEDTDAAGAPAYKLAASTTGDNTP